ncbi:MAG: hypothetical protein PVI15_06885 [Chromatiales bacterium]|jgi:hypothetical protein
MKRRTFIISIGAALVAFGGGRLSAAGAGKGGGGAAGQSPQRDPQSSRGQPEHMRRMEKERDRERYRDQDAAKDSKKMKTIGTDQQ